MQYERDKSLQRQVQDLLSWDPLAYAEFIQDCGIAYLQRIMPAYPQVVKQITTSKVFWNWWKAHWERRDQEFLELIDESPEPMIDTVEMYREHHDPRTLAEAIYLSGQVLQESYAEMFGRLTKSQRRVAA